MSKLGKWRPEASGRSSTGMSVRGKPISNPMLIVDDDEFPIRTPGASIATPLGTEGIEKQLHSRAASAMTRPGSMAASELLASTEYSDTPGAERTLPASNTLRISPSPPKAQTDPVELHRGSKGSLISEGKPQRKKSTLRSVFGKIFGKKQRTNATPQIPERSSARQGQQHLSDPSALNRSTKLTNQRSASLPINEYNRALRSHSTVTEDFPTDSVDLPRRSAQGEGQTRPRRSTTPSRLWTPRGVPGYVDWTGLSPRPASSHARGSKVFTDEEAAIIGVAVTSGSHPNRRSRSVGEIRKEFMHEKPAIRRRSLEIQYWRDSYGPGLTSPMSSNHKPEAEGPTVEDEPENRPEEQPREAPQPFNFGPMREMAKMKITQAASLETRVLRLETRMQEFDIIISRIHNFSSINPIVFQEPPKRSSLRERSISATRPRTNESDMSLPQPNRYRGVQQTHPQREASILGNQAQDQTGSRPSTTSTTSTTSAHPSFTHPSSARPLSTSTTIRGAPPSSPTIPRERDKDSPLTTEHYTILTNMILAERAARHALEGTVRALQHQIRTLQPPLPLPSPRGGLPPPDLRGGLFEGFGESSDEEGGIGGRDREDVEHEEDGDEIEEFRTPNEERSGFGDGVFGGEIEEVKVRTMSLSQMTLGRGMQPSLNF